MIIFETGDVLTQPAFAHGCNCMGVMGAGLAADVKRRFSGAYDDYRTRCLWGTFMPGNAYYWKSTDGTQHIFNLATQTRPGPSASPAWIHNAVLQALEICQTLCIPRLAVPWIGCGLGGLSKPYVQTVLMAAAKRCIHVDLVVFEKTATPAGGRFVSFFDL